MGNYVCRTNRADTVDSIEPLANNPALVSTARQSQDVSKKLNEWVVIFFSTQSSFFKRLTKCGSAKRSSIERTPYRVEHLMEMSKVELEEQIKHAWNPNDKSVNIFVKGDNLTLHRRPISQVNLLSKAIRFLCLNHMKTVYLLVLRSC